MKEVAKAVIFCAIGMAICFVPILYKNHWQLRWNGEQHNLIGKGL